MKNYFTQYKPFLTFLAKFFLTYAVLTLLYQYYLSQYDVAKNENDRFTEVVASQTQKTIIFFGHSSEIQPHESEPSYKLFVNQKYVARVVEGCNAVSVMILFVAFVLAFKGKLITTMIFKLSGCLLIHLLNIIRIALLSIALFYYPQHEHILHGVIFPLVIYGVVFLLWIIWVNKFSVYAKTTSTR
ncbi:exosortase family protein XrtF [Flavobacterium orientale]|uniref:exosortase family protein XrtF n=1 Tax=Flavobacterium orientale TaxID=1756020 RepID=UPI00166AFC1C|nr:exosortase family protein XrtF [Flavobacterium orientale]